MKDISEYNKIFQNVISNGSKNSLKILKKDDKQYVIKKCLLY